MLIKLSDLHEKFVIKGFRAYTTIITKHFH